MKDRLAVSAVALMKLSVTHAINNSKVPEYYCTSEVNILLCRAEAATLGDRTGRFSFFLLIKIRKCWKQCPKNSGLNDKKLSP